MSYYVLPPPVKSLFSTSIAKSFVEDDFVVIDGRVMLPHEIVAKFFEIPLNDIIPAIHYAKQTDLWASVVLELHGRYYFPMPESLIAMLRISKYREAQVDNTFFYRAFEEVRKDILIYRLGFQVRSPYDAEVNNFISKDEFSVVNGKVVLSQEAAARYFGMTVNDLRRAVSSAENSDPFAQEIIRHWGKYYFPSAETVFVLKPFSRYRDTDAAPDFLALAFETMQRELNANRVYSEKSSGMNKNSVSKFPAICLIVMILLFFLANLGYDPKKPPPTQVETQQPKEEPKVETQPTPAPAAKPSTPAPTNKYNYEGRGLDLSSDLSYVGYHGYVSIYYHENSALVEDYSYLDTPWQVPTYERDKQFWTKTDVTIDHKTPIVVREQFIERDKRYDPYEGYLRVERLSDGAQFYIDVDNFVIKAYWDNRDVLEAVKGGGVLVEYHQRSEYWPVTSNDQKKVPPEGSIFFARSTIGMMGKGWVQSSRHQISAFNADYGSICFNKADLTIIY